MYEMSMPEHSLARFLVSLPGILLDCYQCFDSAKCDLANPAHILDILNALERPLLLAIGDDAPGDDDPDARQRYQCVFTSGVDVDLCRLRLGVGRRAWSARRLRC